MPPSDRCEYVSLTALFLISYYGCTFQKRGSTLHLSCVQLSSFSAVTAKNVLHDLHMQSCTPSHTRFFCPRDVCFRLNINVIHTRAAAAPLIILSNSCQGLARPCLTERNKFFLREILVSILGLFSAASSFVRKMLHRTMHVLVADSCYCGL